jgi:hypothetical protein
MDSIHTFWVVSVDTYSLFFILYYTCRICILCTMYVVYYHVVQV